MSILQGFWIGVGAYKQAWNLLFSSGFRHFLVFPVFFLLLLFWGGEWLTSLVGTEITEWLGIKITAWVGEIAWLEWLGKVSGFFVRFMLKLLYFFLFLTFGGYIVLVVMSPVFSWLSEKTEGELTGTSYPFSIRQLLWEVCRGIVIALRNMLFQCFFSFIILLCSFIPVVGLLTPVALFFLSAYFYGFSFVDYAVERKRYNVKKSVRYMNRNAGMVAGVGTVFALSLLIPWFSIVACSFISLFSVVAGTVAVNKINEGV